MFFYKHWNFVAENIAACVKCVNLCLTLRVCLPLVALVFFFVALPSFRSSHTQTYIFWLIWREETRAAIWRKINVYTRKRWKLLIHVHNFTIYIFVGGGYALKNDACDYFVYFVDRSIVVLWWLIIYICAGGLLKGRFFSIKYFTVFTWNLNRCTCAQKDARIYQFQLW